MIIVPTFVSMQSVSARTGSMILLLVELSTRKTEAQHFHSGILYPHTTNFQQQLRFLLLLCHYFTVKHLADIIMCLNNQLQSSSRKGHIENVLCQGAVYNVGPWLAINSEYKTNSLIVLCTIKSCFQKERSLSHFFLFLAIFRIFIEVHFQ